MKIKKFQEIFKNRYSPKEALGYYIKIIRNIENEVTIGELIVLLEKEILIIDNKTALENLSATSLEKVTNYWSLSMEQVIDYGYIVFNNILENNKKLTEKEISETFVIMMKLYSPDNAVEHTNKKFRKW